MFNYEVDPGILDPYLPAYTEIDLYEGKVLVSLVGFMFNDTRVFGIRWPMHTNFEEVNLRFYIRYNDGYQNKRGVSFISEIVPSRVISTLANKLFNECYSSASMQHKLISDDTSLQISYQWKLRGRGWNIMKVECHNNPTVILPGSAEEFILEHYFGYSKMNASTTIEYAVEHPVWQVYPVSDYSLNCDIAGLYGSAFVPFIDGVRPHSVMVAKGSDVIVRWGALIKGSFIPDQY